MQEETYGKRTALLVDFPNSIVATVDSGFAVSARNKLVKIDSEGNVQWSRQFDIAEFRVIQTNDKSLVSAGTIDSGSTRMIKVIKADENGTLLWEKTFKDSSEAIVGMAVAEAGDGGYLVAGTLGTDKLWVTKTDGDGVVQITKTYNIAEKGLSVPPTNVAIHKTKDGGFILAGGVDSGSYFSPWMAKIDSYANLLWLYRYLDGIRFNSVIQVSNGGYLAVGIYSPNESSPSVSPVLIRTDGFGNFQWNETYGAGTASSVISTIDGGYAIVGTMEDEVWFAKFASEGNSVPEPALTSVTTLLVAFIIAVVLVAAVCVGLVVYLRKRRA